jgi:hypothetical protein
MPRLRFRRQRLDKAPKKSKKKGKKGKKTGKAEKAAEFARTEELAKTKKKAGKHKKGKKGKSKLRRLRRGLPIPSRPHFVPKDIYFRISTRFKALGYGAREQAWRLTGFWDRRVEGPARGFWAHRSPRTRQSVLAAAGVLLLFLVIRFIPIPGVPCQISASKECAPGDDAVALAPANSLLYGHLTLNEGTGQYDRAGEVFGRLDRFAEIGQAFINGLPAPSGKQVSFEDVRSWAGDDAALVIVPGTGGVRSTAVLISIDDQKGADAFAKAVAPATKPAASKPEGVELDTYAGGFATASDKGFLILGGQTAVSSVIATGAGKAKALGEDPAAGPARDELPENRFADVYVSAKGAQTLIAPSASTAATQLDTFVDYGATRGFAAAAIARDDGLELDVVSALDPAKEKQSPTLFTALPKFEPELTHDVGSRALGYIGIGDAGKSLGVLLQRASGASPGLAQSVSAFTQRLQQESKIDPAKDLLPALGGQAALVAEPTDGIPFASLIVDGVDEKKARDALARLQGPLVRSLSPPGGQPLSGFTTTTIDGAEANQLKVSPALNLTYAIFDGKLVISTQPTGIEQVKSGGGERLFRAGAFTDATDPLPDELSALVFFNLDELLDLAEALGRVEDPLYASFRDDIRKLHAIAVGVTAGDNELHSRLFVTIK